MGNKATQEIKGNNNVQTINNYNGLKTEDVISLIQNFCKPNKDEIIKIVKDAIKEINIKNIKNPDKRVFVPLIQQLSYSLDDNYLKETYKRLLMSSMNSSNYVHPSFVYIINQLISDEIKILNSLIPETVVLYPLIDVDLQNKEHKGIIKYITNFTTIGYGVCDHPEKICEYIDNLERLKLIEIPESTMLMQKEEYAKLLHHPKLMEYIEEMKPLNMKFLIKEKGFKLTEFGVQFIKACLSDKNTDNKAK